MEIKRILADLRAERNRLDRAITALEALNGRASRDTTERPTTTATQPATKQPHAGRRRMSAAGRKRISEAAKKMWAERKKATTIPSPRRAMSAATKRKLSQLAKARWAENKKKAKAT